MQVRVLAFRWRHHRPSVISVFEFVVAVAAVARGGYLVASDRLTVGLRRRWYRFEYSRRHGADEVDGWDDLDSDVFAWDRLVDADHGEAPIVSYLIRCSWCHSIWLSALFFVGFNVWETGAWWTMVVLAGSILAVLVDRVVAAVAAVARR